MSAVGEWAFGEAGRGDQTIPEPLKLRIACVTPTIQAGRGDQTIPEPLKLDVLR